MQIIHVGRCSVTMTTGCLDPLLKGSKGLNASLKTKMKTRKGQIYINPTAMVIAVTCGFCMFVRLLLFDNYLERVIDVLVGSQLEKEWTKKMA